MKEVKSISFCSETTFYCTKHYFLYQTTADPRWIQFIALTSCRSLSLRMEPWKQSAAVLLYLRELLVVLLFCCSLNIQTNTLDLSLDRGCSSIPPQALSLSLTHKSSTAPPFTPCWVEQLKASVSSWQSPHGRLESVGRVWVCWLRRFMTCKCVG